MGTELFIRLLEERDYDLWSQFVATSSSGSIYALPAYLDILCSVTNARFSIIGVFRGTELVGGMPLYTVRTRAGLVTSDHQLLNYHSPVIRDYTTRFPSERVARQLAVLSKLEEHLRTMGGIHLAMYFRHTLADVRPFVANRWKVLPDYSYIVDIGDLTFAWGRVEQNLRRLIDRAGENGLIHTDDDDFDSFYRLNVEICRRKRLQLELPEASFRVFVERLKAQDLCRLYHARLSDGTPTATQLVLTGPHSVSHTVCAAADIRYLSLGSTPFLRWKSFTALSALGYVANDLTGAPLNDVTRFKRQLGGDLVINWRVIRPETIRYRLYLRTRRTFHSALYRIKRFHRT